VGRGWCSSPAATRKIAIISRANRWPPNVSTAYLVLWNGWALTQNGPCRVDLRGRGDKYARVITEMDRKLASLDKDQIRSENAKARPEISKPLRRWQTVPGMEELLVVEEVKV